MILFFRITKILGLSSDMRPLFKQFHAFFKYPHSAFSSK